MFGLIGLGIHQLFSIFKLSLKFLAEPPKAKSFSKTASGMPLFLIVGTFAKYTVQIQEKCPTTGRKRLKIMLIFGLMFMFVLLLQEHNHRHG
jgi:hypothetical protein